MFTGRTNRGERRVYRWSLEKSENILDDFQGFDNLSVEHLPDLGSPLPLELVDFRLPKLISEGGAARNSFYTTVMMF